jgi:rRNA maturation RNase YbeY
MALTFQFQKKIELKERNRLRSFLREILKKEGKKPGQISFIFCSDEFLLDINKRFLSHDFYTDIITFDLSGEPFKKTDAEIFISGDRVKENALKFKEAFATELHRVMIHGILHLCGYNDKSSKQRMVMRSKEDQYLKAYFN